MTGDALPQRYAHVWWSSAYILDPVAEPPALPAFHELLREVKGRETGWPVWLWLPNRTEMLPRAIDDNVIECWLNALGDDSLADFWRADRRGRMFMLRGYQEDSAGAQTQHEIEPGKYFELTLPIWRTGECLLHAWRLAGRLGATTVDLAMTWSGLKGRQLSSLAEPWRVLPPQKICLAPSVRTSIQADAAAISDLLPELVRHLVAPLYHRFDFFEPPDEFYVEELTRLRR
jgi:hypothetical protein